MCRLAALLVTAALAVAAPPAGALPIATPLDHVRATDSRTRELLQHGLGRSASLRDLVAQLDATDLIVYVEQRPVRFDAGLSGGLTFRGATPEFRYLTVALNIDQTRDEAVSMLAHELQHAVEVSLAAGVRSTATLVAYYRCIGVRWTDHRWDTQLALQMGRRVRREIAHPATDGGGRRLRG